MFNLCTLDGQTSLIYMCMCLLQPIWRQKSILTYMFASENKKDDLEDVLQNANSESKSQH